MGKLRGAGDGADEPDDGAAGRAPREAGGANDAATRARIAREDGQLPLRGDAQDAVTLGDEKGPETGQDRADDAGDRVGDEAREAPSAEQVDSPAGQEAPPDDAPGDPDTAPEADPGELLAALEAVRDMKAQYEADLRDVREIKATYEAGLKEVQEQGARYEAGLQEQGAT